MDLDFSLSGDPVILLLFMNAGFKFQPSSQLLLTNYLEPKIRGEAVEGVPMAEVNLCQHEPWDLPDKSIVKLGDREWYFFCRRDLKYENSKQLTNRKTKAGYWKSTCKIKPISCEHTKKQIGVMRTLTFYRTDDGPKAVRTGWMIYEFDTITDSNLYGKGQYLLCRLENKSKDETTKEGEQNHHMGSVSDSEAEPSQSMDSNSNPTEMTLNSACDESDLSHHVASDRFDSENQNFNELLMTNSARQFSEFSHFNMASHDFENRNSNMLMSNSAYDHGSGSSHSTPFSYSETQYLNQPTVDSVYNGSESHYKAFDSVTQISNNMINSPVDEDRLLAYEKWLMTPDLKDQESPFQHEGECGSSVPMPSKFMKNSTSDSEATSLMDVDFKNQNLDKDIDISDFDEGNWSYLPATTTDFGNQNPGKKTDMSTNLEEGYSSCLKASVSDSYLADVALPEVSSEVLAEREVFVVQENSPNAALDQLPECMEESNNSYMEH